MEEYTRSYNKEDIDAMSAQEGNYGITTDCTAFLIGGLDASSDECISFRNSMVQYQADIDTRIKSIQTAGDEIQLLIDDTIVRLPSLLFVRAQRFDGTGRCNLVT